MDKSLLNNQLTRRSSRLAFSRAGARGQVLVEALVAMGILTVAVFSIFSLLSRSISLNRSVSEQYVATYLAAEAIEVVKNIVESDVLNCRAWNSNVLGTHEVQYDDSRLYRGVSGNPLLLDPISKRYQYNSGDPSAYYRTVRVSNVNADVELKVLATVEWRARGQRATDPKQKVELEDHFYNWLARPASCF